jgi:murein DD-endopeptidase MepM/ murein hydrolase activator NlpD
MKWKRQRRIVKPFLLIVALVFTGCQTLDQVSRVYLSTTPDGRALIERWDHYASIAKTLKSYHDDGELSNDEVLEVLVGVGVIDSPVPGGSTRRPSPDSPPPKPTGSWRWPMKAGVVSSEYGTRGGNAHEGIDIAADPREPIYAAASGEVIYASNGMSGYGNAVILRHDDKTTSLYAHATTLEVRRGSQIPSGAVVATVGSTGRSTGPHLHFEIRVGETPVDPRSVLPRQPF